MGANPHFVDVDYETLGIDVKKLEKYLKKITSIRNGICINKKTKKKISAIIPMHTFGHPVEIDKIKILAKKFKLFLIEDAAEALGSFFKKKHVGTFGDIGILSFNGNKIITTGGGGALLTNNKNIIFTGTLKTISRDEAKHMAKEVGAKILSSVTKNTDYVIVGDKAGSKEKKARELNLNIFFF